MTGPAHDRDSTPGYGAREGPGPPDRPGQGPGDPGRGHEPQRAEGPRHHRQPRGSEPVTARSPLRLRAVMSAIALIAGVVAAVLFGLVADREDSTGAWIAAAICAALALIALTDLVVIARRFRL
jgi:Family of unknown function (DUF6343)